MKKSSDNLQDNSIYDDLDIYNKQNNIYIKYTYDTNYLNYKKKIFLEINYNYNLIIKTFDDNICDILINIYILKKKNKIDDKYFNIIRFIFDFIKKLNEINFIDSENFFIIIIDLYKINIFCIWLNVFFEKNIFAELVDYKLFINNIKNLFTNISKKILIFKIFDELVVINDENLIKEKIIYLAHKISFDLFMFYNSNEIFDIIMSGFSYFNDILFIDGNNNNNNINFIKKNNADIITKNKILSNLFDKYKNLFINEYNSNALNCIEIYSNDIELYIKFKISKSDTIDKFIKNLMYIDNM